MSSPALSSKDKRYCSVEESIRESFKEIKLMREGKKPKRSINELWAKIDEWKKEENNV